MMIVCDKTECPNNKGNECQRTVIVVLDENGTCKAMEGR